MEDLPVENRGHLLQSLRGHIRLLIDLESSDDRDPDGQAQRKALNVLAYFEVPDELIPFLVGRERALRDQPGDTPAIRGPRLRRAWRELRDAAEPFNLPLDLRKALYIDSGQSSSSPH